MIVPLRMIHSTDKDALIEYLVKLLKDPDTRVPVYLQWAYVNSVAIEPEDMELLVQLSAKDFSSESST